MISFDPNSSQPIKNENKSFFSKLFSSKSKKTVKPPTTPKANEVKPIQPGIAKPILRPKNKLNLKDLVAQTESAKLDTNLTGVSDTTGLAAQGAHTMKLGYEKLSVDDALSADDKKFFANLAALSQKLETQAVAASVVVSQIINATHTTPEQKIGQLNELTDRPVYKEFITTNATLNAYGAESLERLARIKGTKATKTEEYEIERLAIAVPSTMQMITRFEMRYGEISKYVASNKTFSDEVMNQAKELHLKASEGAALHQEYAVGDRLTQKYFDNLGKNYRNVKKLLPNRKMKADFFKEFQAHQKNLDAVKMLPKELRERIVIPVEEEKYDQQMRVLSAYHQAQTNRKR